jgi:hypothetical protein
MSLTAEPPRSEVHSLRKITVATLTHHGAGTLLIHGHACQSALISTVCGYVALWSSTLASTLVMAKYPPMRMQNFLPPCSMNYKYLYHTIRSQKPFTLHNWVTIGSKPKITTQPVLNPKACISPEYDDVKALSQDRKFIGVSTTPLQLQGCWKFLSPTRKETSYSDRRFWCSYFLFIIIIGGILVLYIYIYKTRLASNKIHRKVGQAKDLSAPRVQGLCDSTAKCFICRNGSMDKGYQLALCTSLMSQHFGWLQHCFHITSM